MKNSTISVKWNDDDFDFEEEKIDIEEIKYKSNKTWFRNFRKENYDTELKKIENLIHNSKKSYSLKIDILIGNTFTYLLEF